MAGYLFWRPIVGIEPGRHRLHPGLAMVMRLLAIPVDTLTGPYARLGNPRDGPLL